MTTLTVEIDKEEDLPVLQTLLGKMGLKYRFEDEEDEWGGLSIDEIECLKAGIADSDAGRLHSDADVMAHIDKKIKSFSGR